jgi:hypothetical protein
MNAFQNSLLIILADIFGENIFLARNCISRYKDEQKEICSQNSRQKDKSGVLKWVL